MEYEIKLRALVERLESEKQSTEELKFLGPIPPEIVKIKTDTLKYVINLIKEIL